MGKAVNPLPEQRADSMLRFIRLSDDKGKDGVVYETFCECNGSYCGSHEGACGSVRVLNSTALTRSVIQTLAQALRAEPEVRGLKTIGTRQAKTIIEQTLRDGRG